MVIKSVIIRTVGSNTKLDELQDRVFRWKAPTVTKKYNQ